MELKIELKNFRHAPSLSEETIAFTANVHINGKNYGPAKNDGQGGQTWLYSAEGRAILDTYAKTLPPVVTDLKNKDGSPFVYQRDGDSLLDEAVDQKIRSKEKYLRVTKLSGEKWPDGSQYLYFKGARPQAHIAKFYKNPRASAVVTKSAEIAQGLKKGPVESGSYRFELVDGNQLSSDIDSGLY